VHIALYSMYVTMSISIGLYSNLDLWNANKLHYIQFLSTFAISSLLTFCMLEHRLLILEIPVNGSFV